MTTLHASKYDEANDPHKPKIGDPIPEEVGGGVVGRVQVITDALEFMKIVNDADEDGPDPFDVCKDHPERPFVKYLVWRAK